MVANNIIQSVLNVINKANPDICSIRTYKVLHPSKFNNLDLSIYNKDWGHLNITITKEDADTLHLHVASSTGINFYGKIEQLEFLNIQTAILMCVNRFNETISEFCDKFYD